LIVDVRPLKGNPKAEFELAFDIRRATYEDEKKPSSSGATEVSSVV
jgi:hypothetical protein